MLISKCEETELVKERFARRKSIQISSLYDPTDPAVYMGQQEKYRVLVQWINKFGLAPVNNKKVLEIGCGTGGNLLELMRLGFLPENLIGNELLEDRSQMARHLLPEATEILTGDASSLNLPEQSFDVVFQSTVFTSILDNKFQELLADRMWQLVKPGGGVLWYDFIYNNPRNPDVRGVPLSRVKALFPEANITCWRLTLAPPISRRVTQIHPSLYTLFNMFPFFRSHVLCWVKKPE